MGITKRGSRYLCKMLIQGARSAMPLLAKTDMAIGSWVRGLLARSHPNVAVVALAAKMARTVWALLRHGRICQAEARPAYEQPPAEIVPGATNCEWRKEDGLTVERCSENLRRKMALRARPLHEHRDARIPILAAARAPTCRIRLCRLLIHRQSALATGRAFAPWRWARTAVLLILRSPGSSACAARVAKMRPQRPRWLHRLKRL